MIAANLINYMILIVGILYRVHGLNDLFDHKSGIAMSTICMTFYLGIYMYVNNALSSLNTEQIKTDNLG